MGRREEVLVFVASWAVLSGVPLGEKTEKVQMWFRTAGQGLWLWSSQELR